MKPALASLLLMCLAASSQAQSLQDALSNAPNATPPNTTAPAPSTTPSTSPSSTANVICLLPTSRLVFPLTDSTMQDCVASSTAATDARCRRLCWCRKWASEPVLTTTLADCMSVNNTASCTEAQASDCQAVLASQDGKDTKSAPPSSDIQSKNDDKDNDKGTGAWVYVLIAVICACIVGGIIFTVNWYRNRPRPINAPATVTHEIAPPGGLPTWTELDAYDDKMPDSFSSSRPTHRSSIPSTRSSVSTSNGVLSFDRNASIISGVSGTSYHDIDGMRLGHVDEAHAITDTELSLSKDAHRRVFSPSSSQAAESDAQSIPSSSFMSTDSAAPSLFRIGENSTLADSSVSQQANPQSSFISVASTSYLTNNDTFSSQITIPESEDGVVPRSPAHREIEF